MMLVSSFLASPPSPRQSRSRCRSRRRPLPRNRRSPPPADRSAGANGFARRAQQGLSAELMYRLLVGDVALQRGDTALAARAYFEAARDTRDARLARRATEDFACRAPARARARIGAAVGGARTDRRAPEAGDRRALEQGRQRPTAGRSLPISQAELERALAEAAAVGAPPRRSVPAAQSPARERARQGRDVQARPHARAALSQRAGGAFRRRAGRVQHRARRHGDHGDRHAGDRSRARAQARLGAGGAAQGGDPREDSRRTAPPSTSSSCCDADPDSKAALSALAQVRIQQKQYAEAVAILEKLWEKDKEQPRVPVRHGDARDPDEGLGARRNAVRGAEARRLRRRRHRRFLSRADRRGDRPLRARARALQGGARRRARLAREAPRRV